MAQLHELSCRCRHRCKASNEDVKTRGQRLAKEEPKKPTCCSQLPSKIIFLLFLIAYLALSPGTFLRLALYLEELIPGTFYVFFSAILGAGVLWAIQARSEGKANLFGGFPQTLLYRLGLGNAPDMYDSDENVETDSEGSNTPSKDSPRLKDISGFESFDGEYEWNPIANGVEAADSPTDGTNPLADLFESLSGQNDVEKNMLSDFASRMAARGTEANVKEATVDPAGPGDEASKPPDPKDKARLDSLFRHLASRDGGNKEQAIHLTPQRQKLQRKLLQRGSGDSSKSGKNAKADDAENDAAATTDSNAVITQAENVLEDSSKFEALLLELGEDSTKPKALTKAQRKPKARQKGGPRSSLPKVSSTSPPSATHTSTTITCSSNTLLRVTEAPSESMESVRPVRQSAREADEEEKPEEDTTEPVGFQVVENRRARRKDRKDSMPEERPGKDLKDSVPSTPPADWASAGQQVAGDTGSMPLTPPGDRAIAGQQVAGDTGSMPSTPPADRAIDGQQVAPEVVKASTPSAMASQKKTDMEPVPTITTTITTTTIEESVSVPKSEASAGPPTAVSVSVSTAGSPQLSVSVSVSVPKSEASEGPPTAPVASSAETRKPACSIDSISEGPAEATKANQRKSEAAAAIGPPETKSPETKSNRKRWADIELDSEELEFYTSAAVPAKQTEDVCSAQCGSEELKKRAPWRKRDSEDVSSKESRHRTLSAEERQLSAAQSETYVHDSDFGVSDRQLHDLVLLQPEDVDPVRRVADGVDEADGPDCCEEDGEEEADGEDWEWQCPDGYPLADYVCAEPTRCGSCGKMQPVGAKVLRAEESGWAACEDCIRVAYDQPISHQITEAACDASAAALDLSSMTPEQIVVWFKDHGPENSLTQCMQQVMAGNTPRK